MDLFKKKLTPEKLVEILRTQYAKVVSVVSEIDGPFVNLFEAGIFVSSIATSKILTFRKVNSKIFADEFNEQWINYLIRSYSVDGTSPSKNIVVLRLQEKFPIYCELFFKTIDPSFKEKAHDNGIQLMWELFSNCTGKEKPEKDGNFLNLVMASNQLIFNGADIIKEVNE